MCPVRSVGICSDSLGPHLSCIGTWSHSITQTFIFHSPLAYSTTLLIPTYYHRSVFVLVGKYLIKVMVKVKGITQAYLQAMLVAML
jgi:hypothetical protein